MLAVAMILLLLGSWLLLVCLLDFDPTLGVYDLQSLGESIGENAVRWTLAGIGVVALLVGLLFL